MKMFVRKRHGRKKQSAAGLLSALLLFLCLTGCAVPAQGGGREPAVKDFFAMDTYIRFTAYGGQASQALDEAEERMQELEGIWSVTEPSSEVYRMNHSGARPVTLSDDTAEIVRFALDMAERTKGALEPTIYPILRAWGFTGEENRIPEEAEIQELLEKVGYERVILEGDQIQIPEGTELDLGAVGKGFAGDEIIGLLKEKGISSALLDLGGNVQTVGSKPDGSNWRIGLRNPFGEGEIGVLSVSDAAVVTSGNYERYFEGEDGKIYGHILDPVTGYPVENELAAMTVIAKTGKLGDALSTSLFVMGLDKAAQFWRENPEFEMIAVTKDQEVYLTEGVQEDFALGGAFAGKEIKEVFCR